jgi:hypothetical protein
MPPKSQAFRRIERRLLGPAMRDLGFGRPPGVGLSGWIRAEQESWLLVWTQLGKWNYGDNPEGYRFTMELQLGSEPFAGGFGRRLRYYKLLDRDQKQNHLAIYNQAIAKAKPDPELMSLLNERDQARHVDELRPRDHVPDRWDDPWLPYLDEADVEAWMGFLAEVLPAVLDRFLWSDETAAGG